MFAYYLSLGTRSLKRNLVLTVLMITAIAVGIGASMTALAVFRAMSGDPIPHKSQQLFVPQIDSWGPNKPGQQGGDDLEVQVSYIDAMAWMKAGPAKRQSAMYATSVAVRPPDPGQKPFKAVARAVYASFFPMFDVPIKYGRAWSQTEDEDRAAVVILTREMNERLFGGVNSVGKSIRLNDQTYTVAAVLDDWRLTPRFYDTSVAPFGDRDQMFIPFTLAVDKQMHVNGGVSCKAEGTAGWEAQLRSDCLWLEYWVELPGAADVEKYAAFLHNYAADARRSGRFDWPPHTGLRNVVEWLSYRHIVPNEIRILILVSFGFLLVCLLNAMGLMLAKIMARAGDIGVRRALGASRGAIFAQCLVETGIVGLAGGVFGLALCALGLLAARVLLPAEFAALAHLDFADVGIAILLSVTAAVVAGLYPTWRAANVQPAWQLKAQ